MNIKNFRSWLETLKLYNVDWGLTYNQTLSWLAKHGSAKQNLIPTNWLARHDFEMPNKNQAAWGYYHRRLNEIRVDLEWHRFIGFWQKIKWRGPKRILFYTDVFSDYPFLRHLAKQTNECYAVGWYPGLNSNRRGLKMLRHTRLVGKIEIDRLPSIVVTLSTFYPISTFFLKEFGRSNIYLISFVSFGDICMPGAYKIFTTKTYTSYYFYSHLIRRLIYTTTIEEKKTALSLPLLHRLVRCSTPKQANKVLKSRLNSFRWLQRKTAVFISTNQLFLTRQQLAHKHYLRWEARKKFFLARLLRRTRTLNKRRRLCRRLRRQRSNYISPIHQFSYQRRLLAGGSLLIRLPVITQFASPRRSKFSTGKKSGILRLRLLKAKKKITNRQNGPAKQKFTYFSAAPSTSSAQTSRWVLGRKRPKAKRRHLAKSETK